MQEENLGELLHIYSEMLFAQKNDTPIPSETLGGYEKKVLVMIRKTNLQSEHKVMLEKMLAACNLAEADYLMMQVSQDQVLTLVNKHRPISLILFDLTLQNEAFEIRQSPYQPFKFAGMNVLMADALSAIADSQDKKKTIWNKGLKPLFNIT